MAMQVPFDELKIIEQALASDLLVILAVALGITAMSIFAFVWFVGRYSTRTAGMWHENNRAIDRLGGSLDRLQKSLEKRDDRDLAQRVEDEASRREMAGAMATMSATVARAAEIPAQVDEVLDTHSTLMMLEFTKRDTQFKDIGEYLDGMASHISTLADQFRTLSSVSDDTRKIRRMGEQMQSELNRLTDLTEKHMSDREDTDDTQNAAIDNDGGSAADGGGAGGGADGADRDGDGQRVRDAGLAEHD